MELFLDQPAGSIPVVCWRHFSLLGETYMLAVHVDVDLNSKDKSLCKVPVAYSANHCLQETMQ